MIEATINDLALNASRRFGRKTALKVVGGASLSFDEIDDMAARVAGGLAARGIGVGDRVVLHFPNSWQWVVAYHAIARLGAVVVPTNILLTAEEVAFIAEDSQAVAMFVPAEKRAAIKTAAQVFTLSRTDGCEDFDVFLAGNYKSSVKCAPDDLLSIGYTSGTTGKPKGATITHGGLFASLAGTATIHVRTAQDIVLTMLPFAHVYGNIVVNTSFLTGSAVVTAPRFDAGEALRLIGDEQASLFEGVPTMYYQMLAHPDAATANLGSLTRCTVGGQTMPRAKIDAVTQRFGCPLLELWGMTEVAGPAVTHSPYWPSRPGSIGLPMPGLEVRIASLDDTACDAKPGEAGELMVRGAMVTKGYWRNAKATAETIGPGGWLASGDIVRAEADGYLYIVDRRKDLIITAGYNVYPAELEQVIAMLPDVVMVAVAGIADDEKGELAQAYIVRQPGSILSEDDVAGHCRRYLAAYKVPRRVVFVEDLPKNSTGKILRRKLGGVPV